MTELVLEFDASGPLDQVRQIRGRIDNPRPMLALLGRELEDYEREVFRTRGFGTWEANDLDTLAHKGAGRVLVDTGGLLNQLTAAHVSGDDVMVDQGSKFYARFLRDGDRGMPKRNPAPRPSAAHVDRWANMLLGYIVTGRTR